MRSSKSIQGDQDEISIDLTFMHHNKTTERLLKKSKCKHLIKKQFFNSEIVLFQQVTNICFFSF